MAYTEAEQSEMWDAWSSRMAELDPELAETLVLGIITRQNEQRSTDASSQRLEEVRRKRSEQLGKLISVQTRHGKSDDPKRGEYGTN